MKRIETMLLVLCLLFGPAAAGGEGSESLWGYGAGKGYAYVTLGRYPQRIDGGLPEERNNTWIWASNTISDPSSVTVHTDPVLWRVLTVDEEKAYLCSEYVLFAMPMHTNVTEYKKIGQDFGRTDLSRYLNTVFAEEAFTPEETAMLLPNGSFGKVFLLDAADVKNKRIGMGTGLKKGLKAWATEYAVRITKAFVYKVAYGAHSPYWVRNQASSDARHARCTKERGELGHIVADRDNEGVRPAVWLAMNSFTIESGSGAREDPFVIVPAGTESGSSGDGV